MAGSRPYKLKDACPTCHHQNMVEISYRGNHGEEWLLETHCNWCGFSMDPEGRITNSGNPNIETPVFVSIYAQREINRSGSIRGERG